MLRLISVLTAVVCLANSSLPAQQKMTREEKVRADLKKVTNEGFWIYNDLPLAFEKAKDSGKPILVVLRCIPCEECVKLDDDLVDTDPVLRPLLEKFVCVRVVSTNGLDLSLFQYDTDQSFAVFMLNADRTIYGRFGTRSHRTEWIGDVSLTGLAATLRGALELHDDYPANRSSLLAKTGAKPLFEKPELFPSLKEKYTSSLNYSGDVVKSCIHCHQIGDAVREYYRERNEPIPEVVLTPYPHPKSIGIILDPATTATLKDVTSDSPAEQAGLHIGDQILSINGQPILSMADIQWILHNLPASRTVLAMTLQRDGKQTELNVALPENWRRLDDISWRVSSWGLRRMVTGGIALESTTPEERQSFGVPEDQMALRVRHVGQYGPHAAAKNAGVQKGDILVAYDSRTDLLTDSDVLRYGVTARRPGETVVIEVMRDGQRKRLKIPMQK